MSYVNKNIQTRINNTDACGAGMKKAGLVYGSDWARVPGSKILSKTPSNITFSLHGSMSTCCGIKATTNLHSSQRAYRNYRTALN